MSRRLILLKTVLWALVGICAVVTVARFTHGLGAVTNLSDAAPWGLWIGFDVMAGVALAAGGFVLAAVVYIFGLEKYRPFVRPAILTAFLGYVAVAVGLLYDLGLPWNIWHPMIYWQYQSVLFEVAMCVMTYLTVLALEFSPVVLEHPLFGRPIFQTILSLLRRAVIPLVIAGIVLSTLHQSSLGSLFLITPYRLHPLWYSPIIHVLFFISAVALGLMTVILESLLSAYFLGHKIRAELLRGLGLAAAAVLGLYTVLRLGDLALRGALKLDGSWQSVLFVFELSVSAVIPAALLALRPVRNSVGGLGLCAGLTVFGMVLNRLDVCIVAFARPEGMAYFPSWMELSVTLGIVAGGGLIFLFFVERLNVYGEEHPSAPAGSPERQLHPEGIRDLSPYSLQAPRWYSLVAILAATFAVAFLPERALLGSKPEQVPVAGSRTLEGQIIPSTEKNPPILKLIASEDGIQTGARQAPLLVIDGNRNGNLVFFDHEGHERRLAPKGEPEESSEDSCGQCHHLNLPLDRQSSCYECHRHMYESTNLFDHATHIRKLDGNVGCRQCHEDTSVAKTLETATACQECHADLTVPGSLVEAPEKRWREAAGYMDAMHKLCIPCHEDRAKKQPEEFPSALIRCEGCHNVDHGVDLFNRAPYNRQLPAESVQPEYSSEHKNP